MKNNSKGFYSAVYFIVVFIVSLIIMTVLSPEGTAGLWRKIVHNIFVSHMGGILVIRLLVFKEKLFKNTILHILVWISVYAVAAVISVPCFKDFSAEHIVIEVPGSSFDVFRESNFKVNSYYILLATGEEIEISSEHYWSLLGVHDGTLRIEYYPNTLTAVRLSGHN